MFNIDNDGTITLTRGDNASAPLFINMGTKLKPIRYNLKEHPNDKIYFAVMQVNECFEDAILKQVYTNEDVNDHGDVIIKFNHDDTKCLTPGKYYYQIKAILKDKNGEEKVNTINDRTQFFITE